MFFYYAAFFQKQAAQSTEAHYAIASYAICFTIALFAALALATNAVKRQEFPRLWSFLERKLRKELSALLRFGLRFTRCTRFGQLGITGKEFNAMLRIACRYLRHTLRLLAAAFRPSAKSSQCAVKPPCIVQIIAEKNLQFIVSYQFYY
ncbi:hypothetical protein [Phascolarctobacterium sp.]